jgi:hypothetical protein
MEKSRGNRFKRQSISHTLSLSSHSPAHPHCPPLPSPCSQVVAVKAPGFGERKTSYLEDIAILTGGTMVKDELGVSLEKSGEEVLGKAAKVRGGGRERKDMAGREGRGAELIVQDLNLLDCVANPLVSLLSFRLS